MKDYQERNYPSLQPTLTYIVYIKILWADDIYAYYVSYFEKDFAQTEERGKREISHWNDPVLNTVLIDCWGLKKSASWKYRYTRPPAQTTHIDVTKIHIQLPAYVYIYIYIYFGLGKHTYTIFRQIYIYIHSMLFSKSHLCVESLVQFSSVQYPGHLHMLYIG